MSEQTFLLLSSEVPVEKYLDAVQYSKEAKIMARPNSETSACDNEVAITELLEDYNQYIVALAWKSCLRGAMPSERLSGAIDELTQNVRLKLWQAMQKQAINHIKAYIRRIVQHEAVNILRQEKYKPASPLPINEEGELYQGHLLAGAGGNMQDALDKIEQEETIADFTTIAAGVIQKLPPRQQRAMICTLKDRIDDALPLLQALMDCEIDINNISWPEEKEDAQRLKASLSAVRKKLHILLDHPEPLNCKRTAVIQSSPTPPAHPPQSLP